MTYETHAELPEPEGDQVLWRYMDLSKLLSLLQTQSLFFSRADLLGDPFEGSMPRANLPLRDQAFTSLDEPKRSNLISMLSDHRRKIREQVFVNSWHASEFESAAMWHQYAQTGAGIAIRTTFQDGREAFDLAEERVTGCSVTYIDFSSTPIPEGNLLYPYSFKRLSFKHEDEVRFFVWVPDDEKRRAYPGGADTGIYVKVALEKLLGHIYVSPNSPEWIVDVIRGVVHKFQLEVPVEQSGLNESPVY